MYTQSDSGFIRQLLGAFTSLGATIPKAVAHANKQAAQLVAAGDSLPVAEGLLLPAIAAAVADGRDPAADPEVQRLVTARAIGTQGGLALTSLAAARLQEACCQHADEIVAAWSSSFDTAAAALTEAHGHLGPVPLEDTTSIIARGPDAAVEWARAQTATATLESVRVGWLALAALGRINLDVRYSALRIAEVDAATWQQHRLQDKKNLTAWEALSYGLCLSLPTLNEYRQRLARLQQGLQGLDQQSVPLDPERSHIAGRPIRMNIA